MKLVLMLRRRFRVGSPTIGGAVDGQLLQRDGSEIMARSGDSVVNIPRA